MTPEEIEKLVKNGTPAIVRDRPIGSRRYNLIVFKNTDEGKKVIETIEYLTLKTARELKAEYLREDNLRCDIVEDVTTDRNGNEISFTEKPEPAIVCGKTNFNTPAATKNIIERDRRARRNKAPFVRQSRKVKIEKNKSHRMPWENTWQDKDSPLHKEYMENVKRSGYTVTDKITGTKFAGLQREVSEYIYYLLSGGRNKNDLDIRFNGV